MPGKFLILLSAALCVSSGHPPPTEPVKSRFAVGRPQLFTLLDHYERGRQAVADFVRRSDASGSTSDLLGTLRRSKASCVQIAVRFRRADSNYESTVASGVIVDAGRRVLTAGHVFAGDGEAEITVHYANGITRPGRLIAHEYNRFGRPGQDWALLAVTDAPTEAAAPLAVAPLTEGEMVIVAGFPDAIGIDSSGKVSYAAVSEGSRHEPLVSLAIVERLSPLSLRPWIGSIPTRGISGGPIFNLDGQLAGVFVSISSTRIGEQVTHSYDACPIEVLSGRAELATARVSASGRAD